MGAASTLGIEAVGLLRHSALCFDNRHHASTLGTRLVTGLFEQPQRLWGSSNLAALVIWQPRQFGRRHDLGTVVLLPSHPQRFGSRSEV